MIKITLTGPELKRLLKAASLAASDDPSRSALAGAYIAKNGDIVTTNGSWLTLIEAPVEVTRPMLVPAGDLLRAVAAIGKFKGECTFTAKREDTGESFKLVADRVTEWSTTREDTSFPEYKRILSINAPTKSRFNANLLSELSSFFVTLTGESKHCPINVITSGEEGPSIFQCVPANNFKALAALMSLRGLVNDGKGKMVDVLGPEFDAQVKRLGIPVR